MLLPALLVSLLWACAPAPVGFCEGAVRYDYAPDRASSFTTFPDDFWTEPDGTSPTGKRVSMAIEDNPVFADYPENYADWYTHLSTLSGFGVNSGIFLRFTGDLRPEDITAERVHVVSFGAEGPTRHAVEILTTDREETLLLRPWRALPEETTIAVVLETDPADPSCVAPSATLRALLSPETELARGEEAPARSAEFVAALAAVGLPAERVGAMTVFTTQTITRASLAVAEHVATTTPTVDGARVCVEELGGMRCDLPLTVNDYRGPDRIVPDDSGAPQASYALPVRVWMPLSPGPHPVVLCGHGLGGGVNDCDVLVPEAMLEGLAVVAVDAVEHGDHPARSEPELELIENFMIFALRVTPPGIHGLVLRDNFRQSAWDKLQVLRAIELGLDVDGDGAVDLDAERLVYAGVSLGAIMAPELLALSDAPVAAWTAVGGARLTQIIQDSPSFSILVDVMRPASLDDGDIDRAFPLLQTMVDPGDPASWAPHVLEDRLLDDGPPPHLALLIAQEDEVVPNSTNDLLALAYGLPGVGTELWPVEGLTFTPGDARANLPGGLTGGVVQFGLVHRAEGAEATPAEHAHLHDSVEGFDSVRAFLLPTLWGETPTLLAAP